MFVPLSDDGVANQHCIAEHFWRKRIEQLFLLTAKGIGDIHEFLMRIHHRAADAGEMLQAQADALRPRHLACQQRIGFHLGDVGGVGTLDSADIGVVRIVVDVDDRREIIVDAEPPHLGKARGEDRVLLIRCKEIEFPRTGKRRKAAVFLQPPHQSTFLVDEHHRPRRQRGNLGAEALHLFRQFNVVVVFSRPTGIVEQDHPAETVAGRKFLQPIGNDLAEEAEDEEFADVIHCGGPPSIRHIGAHPISINQALSARRGRSRSMSRSCLHQIFSLSG